MISFRTRPEGTLEWTLVTIQGQHEELLGHSLAIRLADSGWEAQAARDGAEFEDVELDWED